MRAGAVYIKVPISTISYGECKDDVGYLKDSIRTCGQLQPVGIVQRESGYKLVFGSRRVKACKELGMKYIHAVLLTVREGEEESFALNEDIHRKSITVDEIAKRITELNGSVEEMLSLSDEQTENIKNYLLLNEQAKKLISRETERYLKFSGGESEYFARMCKLADDIPSSAKEHIHLSVLSDRRIFINEIEKILKLMRQGGFEDDVTEDEDKIIIEKRNRAG